MTRVERFYQIMLKSKNVYMHDKQMMDRANQIIIKFDKEKENDKKK